jgi:hypothetical protein
MVRTSWKSALIVLLAWGGLAFGQRVASQAPPMVVNGGTDTFIEVTEPGRPTQKCRVLYCWTMEDGKRACQVQSVTTGEIMTIVDPPLPPGAPELVVENPQPKTASRQIFRWGRSKTCPAGFPAPPEEKAVIVQGDCGCNACIQGQLVQTGPPPTLQLPGQVVQGSGSPNLVEIASKTPTTTTTQPRPGFGNRIKSLFGKKSTPDTEANLSQSVVVQPSVETKVEVVKRAEVPPTVQKFEFSPPPPPKVDLTKKSELPPPPLPRTDLAKADGPPPLSSLTLPPPPPGPRLEDKARDPLLDVKSFAPKTVQDKFPSVASDNKKPLPQLPGQSVGGQPGYQGMPQGGQFSYQGQPQGRMAFQGLPPGSRSVVEANNGINQPMRILPVPVVTVPTPNAPPGPPPPMIPNAPAPNAYVNAFTPPVDPNTQAKGPQVSMMPGYPFSGAPGGFPMAGPMMNPQMAYGPRPPMAYPPMMPPYNPYPNMMAYGPMPQYPAPSPRGYQGPLPPNPFQNQPVAQVGYQQPGYYAPPMQMAYANPAMDRPGMAPNAYQPTGPDAVYQHLTILKSSLYPAQREWSVLTLARFDWRQNPHVVQGLLVAAKEDPAPSVRAACIRALAEMNVPLAMIRRELEPLQSDSDPRVRQAAQQALSGAGVAHVSASAATPAPTSGPVPASPPATSSNPPVSAPPAPATSGVLPPPPGIPH